MRVSRERIDRPERSVVLSVVQMHFALVMGLKDCLMIDPTYNAKEIEADPVWKRAFEISEMENDHSPLGWSRLIFREPRSKSEEARGRNLKRNGVANNYESRKSACVRSL